MSSTYKLTNKQDVFLKIVKHLSHELSKLGHNCRGINSLASIILSVGSYEEDDKINLNAIGVWYMTNKYVISKGKSHITIYDIQYPAK